MICPTFLSTDPNLEKKVEKCLQRGSGYVIKYESIKAYLEMIKETDK